MPHEENFIGLAGEHDYAVIDMKELEGRRLFLVKNPWTEGATWKGYPGRAPDVEHGTRETVPSSEKTELLAPGTFWMNLNDVLQNFETVYLNWNPGLFSYREDIHFTWDLRTTRSREGSFDRNPQYVIRSTKGGTVWLLLTKHIQDMRTVSVQVLSGHGEEIGFLSLYAYINDGYRVFLTDNSLIRSPYVDAPNSLLRLEMPGNSVYTIVVSEQALPELSYNLTLSAFSINPFTISQAEDKYSHSTSREGAWTFSTAGGNAFSFCYHINPQFSLTLPRASDLALLLESDNSDFAINVKLLWAGGKRMTSIMSRDIVGDSGEYRRGSCIIDVRNVQAGAYTVVCSMFAREQLGKFSLHVRSMVECSVKALPLEEAGRLVTRIPPAPFAQGIDRLAIPLQVSRVTRLRLHVRVRESRMNSAVPLRVALEYGHGPDKMILAISGNGDFSNSLIGSRTEEVDLLPSMCEGHGVWVVVERIGGSYVSAVEQAQVEILSDHAVQVGAWGRG